MNKTPIDILLDQIEFTPIENPNQNDGSLYATHEGYLKIEGFAFKVYQLNDGRRVIEEESLISFFNT